jgi:hypothetical protein
MNSNKTQAKEELVGHIKTIRYALQEFPYGSHVLEAWANSISEELIRFKQELIR